MSNVYDSIFLNDTQRIPSFFQVPTSQVGDYVIHVNKPKKKVVDKDYKLLTLYKWESSRYVHCDPKAFLKDPNYKSFAQVNGLFDNYNADETKKEVKTRIETKEEQDFIVHIEGTKAFGIAYDYWSTKLKQKGTKSDFRNILKDKWFQMYDWGRRKDISAFEHTFVGEENEKGALGFHFWFKYLMDDSGYNTHGKDIINFGALYGNPSNPECVAVRFTIDFVEGDHDNHGEKFKPASTFFVGVSPISMMLMGILVYYETMNLREEDDQGINAEINGKTYQLICHHGGYGGKYMRTFFPTEIY